MFGTLFCFPFEDNLAGGGIKTMQKVECPISSAFSTKGFSNSIPSFPPTIAIKYLLSKKLI